MPHTPGPWTWENEEEAMEGWLIRSKATDNNDIVATVPKTGDEDYDNEVTYRNARLIAASPELLAALEPIAELYHEWIADESGMGHPRVSQFATDGPREKKFAGISLTKEQVLRIVALVTRVKP